MGRIIAAVSFDLFFQSGRHEGFEERFNPFTRETQRTPRPAPLSSERVRAVKELFARAGEKRGVIDFHDGTSVHVSDDVAKGCLVTPEGFGDDCAQFLYELLVAGDWIAHCGPAILAASNDCVTNAPDDFPKPMIITSANEMKAVVMKGLAGFRAIRDASKRST
jgi:hypothetical protein